MIRLGRSVAFSVSSRQIFESVCSVPPSRPRYREVRVSAGTWRPRPPLTSGRGPDGVRTLGQSLPSAQTPILAPGLHVPVPHVIVIYTLTCRAFYRSVMRGKSFVFIHAHHNPAFFLLCADLPAHLVSLFVLLRELPEPSSWCGAAASRFFPLCLNQS